MKINSKLLNSELLFTLYYFGFTLLKIVIYKNQNYSKIILACYSLIIIIFSFFNLKQSESKKILKAILLISIIIIIFLVDLLFRYNGLIKEYIYNFLIYGIIPIYLLSNVNDSRKLLKVYSIMSVIIYCIYAFDPINGYIYTGDYMQFGFEVALPCYIGLYVGRKYFKYKWIILPEVICLLEMVFFANRSTLLSVAFLWIITILFLDKKSLKKNIQWLMNSSIIIFIIVLFLKELTNIIFLFESKGYRVYILRTIQEYITTKNIKQFSSGRTSIWSFAIDTIKNNILLGKGTAWFENRYNFYSHNIIIDLLVQYGIIGVIIFTILLIKSIINISRFNYCDKLLAIVFLCSWCPKLFFSQILFKDIAIWCFFAIALCTTKTFTNRDIRENGDISLRSDSL